MRECDTIVVDQHILQIIPFWTKTKSWLIFLSTQKTKIVFQLTHPTAWFDALLSPSTTLKGFTGYKSICIKINRIFMWLLFNLLNRIKYVVESGTKTLTYNSSLVISFGSYCNKTTPYFGSSNHLYDPPPPLTCDSFGGNLLTGTVYPNL